MPFREDWVIEYNRENMKARKQLEAEAEERAQRQSAAAGKQADTNMDARVVSSPALLSAPHSNIQPTLVVNGHTDIVIATVNSFILQQHIPSAQLILYPDSGHGSHFQYPQLFMAQTRLFLDA